MKIVVDKAIPFINGRFPQNVTVEYCEGKAITPELLKDADALIVRTRTICDENLLKDTKVKIVATATIGTDHIDIPWCESNGIIVRNSPGCNAPGVGQYVFASLFKLGFDPRKDTLGIIGYGHVGSLIADWASQMGIKTLVSDNPRKEAGFNDIEYLSPEEVLKNSKAVTLHVPLTASGKYATYHMIGEKELRLMAPGGILVNSSRGGVVDEFFLKKYLKEGKLAAVVDVWENEPKVDSELLNLVAIATPHIAGYSYEGKKRGTEMALQAVKDYLDIPVDFTGLECKDIHEIQVSHDKILNSYDPEEDTLNLKKNVSDFENLRNNYKYRFEP